MNSTLAQLLNNLSLKLNSRLNADEQTPANASALVNPVSNTSAANISLAAGSEANSPGEQNSSIISISFSTLQTELGEVRTERSERVEKVICAFKGVGGGHPDIDRACRRSYSLVGSKSGFTSALFPKIFPILTSRVLRLHLTHWRRALLD